MASKNKQKDPTERVPTTIQARPRVMDVCRAAASFEGLKINDWIEKKLVAAALASEGVSAEFRREMAEFR